MARPQAAVTKEAIAGDLRRVAKKIKSTDLQREDYRKHGKFSCWQIEKLFGGFRQAMAFAAGLTDEVVKQAIADGESASDLAARFGLTVGEVERTRTKFIRQGHSPAHDMTHMVPDGFKVKGVSSYYGKDGQLRGQWVKSTEDRERMVELVQQTINAMAEDLPRSEPVPPPAECLADLMNCYVITDYHLGMLAWSEETRDADYDLAIAEQQLIQWFGTAIALAPNSEIGVFAQLGDFMHWDGLDAVTPTSKHILDADTRFQKLVRVAIRVIRAVMDMLLAKHKVVHLLLAEGNHDMASSIWMRELMAFHFEHEPRVIVDVSPDPYYCIEHGKTSIFFHHGHKKKMANLDDVFVAKFREVFGRTKHSYAHTGHLHHVDIKETNLMIVEQHRTLAPSDAHASRGGWMSGRDAKVITYSRRYGEVGRLTINPDMLRA